MASPLIDRLRSEFGYPRIDLSNNDAFVNQETACILFFAGDPKQFKDTNDVAVVLPELIKEFDGRLRAGVIAEDAEKPLQPRYGFRKWPALVLVRNGGYLGAIPGIRTWDVYRQKIETLLNADPKPPPAF